MNRLFVLETVAIFGPNKGLRVPSQAQQPCLTLQDAVREKQRLESFMENRYRIAEYRRKRVVPKRESRAGEKG